MGSAARYPTANVEAMKTIAWDRSTQEALTEQWQYVKAIPEVPGGYFTSRYFDFAFRDVVLDGKDVRETMVSSAREINNEIRKAAGIEAARVLMINMPETQGVLSDRVCGNGAKHEPSSKNKRR